MASIFSKIIAREIPAHIVAEDDQHIAFLDVSPVAKGHTLVVPKREDDYIFDRSDDELAALMAFAKRVAKAVQKVVPCRRIGVSVIGLEVPHTHVHLIPIHSVSDMTFTNERLKLSQEEFTELAKSIKAQLSE